MDDEDSPSRGEVVTGSRVGYFRGCMVPDILDTLAIGDVSVSLR